MYKRNYNVNFINEAIPGFFQNSSDSNAKQSLMSTAKALFRGTQANNEIKKGLDELKQYAISSKSQYVEALYGELNKFVNNDINNELIKKYKDERNLFQSSKPTTGIPNIKITSESIMKIGITAYNELAVVDNIKAGVDTAKTMLGNVKNQYKFNYANNIIKSILKNLKNWETKSPYNKELFETFNNYVNKNIFGQKDGGSGTGKFYQKWVDENGYVKDFDKEERYGDDLEQEANKLPEIKLNDAQKFNTKTLKVLQNNESLQMNIKNSFKNNELRNVLFKLNPNRQHNADATLTICKSTDGKYVLMFENNNIWEKFSKNISYFELDETTKKVNDVRAKNISTNKDTVAKFLNGKSFREQILAKLLKKLNIEIDSISAFTGDGGQLIVMFNQKEDK